MKVRALKKFETIRDLERNVIPKEGDIWETSEERAKFLLSHGVIEIVEEIKEEKKDITETEFDIRSKEVKKLVDETLNKMEETLKQEKPKKTTKKKTSKK